LNPHAGNRILIAPVGGFGPEGLAEVELAVARVFGATTAVQPLLPDLSFAFDTHRDQYHSTPILSALAAAAPPWAFKVLALTEVDLFIPILTHVFGEAQLGGRCCIVSLRRLNPAAFGFPWAVRPEPGESRIVKEAVHELGHTFGLRHCRDARCTMHYCRSETDVDRKSGEFCRYCRTLLADALRKPGPPA
jgi:archaemetzincin